MSSPQLTKSENRLRIFLADAIVPIVPAIECWPGFGICVDERGYITAIDQHANLRARFPDAEIINLEDQLLLPGLVNCHCHAAMSLMRGLCNDKPLQSWLEQSIWPVESNCLSHDFVVTGTELAIAEMLQTGTTCFNDMYLFAEASASVVDRCGIRAILGLPVIDFANPWAKSAEHCLELSTGIVEQWHDHTRIDFALSPHAPYSVCDDSFAKLQRWHDDSDESMLIQIHLHESADEITVSDREFGHRPIRRLEKLGLLERPLLAIHMSQANEDDIELCRRHDVAVAHCPQSNAHFANGIAPLVSMRTAGLRLGLGTDSAASNNDLNLYDEMSFAALAAKLQSGQADALNAAQALWLATMGGASALGLADKVGSLEVGKSADFQAIEFCGWSSEPAIDVIRLLVYARDAFRVRGVWVQGQQLMGKDWIRGIDKADLKDRVNHWTTSVIESCSS